MGQMFDKTRDQMNNWRCDIPRAFRDQVHRSNPQTTSIGKVERTGERFPWYGSDDLRAMIEPPSCRQYKPGNFLPGTLLYWNEIIDEDNDDKNWADPRAPCSGRSRLSDSNDNDDSEGEEDTQGSEKGTGKGKSTKDGQGKGKGKATEEGKWKGKGNGKGKGIVTQTPGGDNISRTVALQLQMEMYEADTHTEGKPEQAYLEPEASPTVSVSSDDDTGTTTESDSKYNSDLDSDVDMCMEDDVDAPDSVDLDSDVDMERDGDNEEEEDGEEEDEEEEDKNEDIGKEPRTIGQGEIVNTSADDVDTMVDNKPIVLPEQGQEMREHTPRPQRLAPSAWHQTPEPCPWPWTPDIYPLSGLDHFGLVTPQIPRPAVPTLRKPEAAGNTSDVDVDQQMATVSLMSLSPICLSQKSPGWLGRRGVNQSLHCREGDGCCVSVRVGFWYCSFPLF